VAAFAGAKACCDAVGCGGAEGAVLLLGFARGAGEAAEDACGRYADIDLPVIACIAVKQGLVECGVVRLIR